MDIEKPQHIENEDAQKIMGTVADLTSKGKLDEALEELKKLAHKPFYVAVKIALEKLRDGK